MDVDEDRRGIIPRGRKFVVHMRLPGGKKTWIPVANMETAKRIVKIIKIYVTGFKALGDDHPDGPGLLDEFRSAEFKQVVLQALESETDFLQQEGGVNQSTTAEVPEDSVHRLDRDRGKTEEPPMPPDAPESSSVCFACGVRGAVLVQDPRNPPRQTQAGVDPRHLAEFVGRLIVAKERRHQKLVIEHEEEMAELGLLWRKCRDEEQRCATQGVTPTYESTEPDTTIQASVQCGVYEPLDARGVTPQFDDEVLAMADGFIVDYEAPEGKKYLGEEL